MHYTICTTYSYPFQQKFIGNMEDSTEDAKDRRDQYPVIMTRMQNQTVKEGEPVRFFVEFVAWPIPKVSL